MYFIFNLSFLSIFHYSFICFLYLLFMFVIYLISESRSLATTITAASNSRVSGHANTSMLYFLVKSNEKQKKEQGGDGWEDEERERGERR